MPLSYPTLAAVIWQMFVSLPDCAAHSLSRGLLKVCEGEDAS